MGRFTKQFIVLLNETSQCQKPTSRATPRGRARTSVRLYCLKTTGGPLTRFAFRATVTSTRLAILMKGMPLFIP